MASLSKNRDIKKTPQVDIAEDLSTSGTISAHQCMVTMTAAPIEGKSACSARELEEYEDVREILSWRTVVLGGGDEQWGDGFEICKGWRCGLDSSCEKEEEQSPVQPSSFTTMQ